MKRYLPRLFLAGFWIQACLCLTVGAQVAGDLNADGRLNVADLVRIHEMLAGNVAMDPAADLDADGAVTDYDAYLLSEAVRGVPLATPLASATIGPEGGSLDTPGFQLVVPAAALTEDATLSVLADQSRAGLEEVTPATDVYVISGLPRGVAGVQVRLDLPPQRADEPWLLAAGELVIPNEGDQADWYYHFADGAVTEGSQLVWTLPAMPPLETTARDGWEDVDKGWGVLKLTVCEGAMYRIYNTAHFRIYAPDSLDEDEIIQIQDLGDHMEAAHDIVKAQGFTFDSSWFPVTVKVKKMTGKDGVFVPYMVYGGVGHLEINRATLGKSSLLRIIAAHEFFHYVQTAFGSTIQNTWLDEAASTWIEKRISGDANYVPSVWLRNMRAPFNGMHHAVSREFKWTLNPREIYNYTETQKGAWNHGYGMAVFFEYLSARHDWDSGFWGRVYGNIKAKQDAVSAVRNAYNGTVLFSQLYEWFLRDYIAGKVPYTTGGAVPLFRRDGGTPTDRYRQTARTYSISKFEDLTKVYEFTYNIQDLGGGTALFRFKKPRLIPPDTILHLEGAEDCDWLVAMKYSGAGVTEYSAPTYDSADKIWKLDIPLDYGIDTRLFIVGIGVMNSDTLSPHTDVRDVKLTASFSLPPVIEPATTTWVWDYSVYEQAVAGGSLEVEPGTIGMFNVESLTLGDPESMHHVFTGYRYAEATMLKPFPQTMRLYADVIQEDMGEITVWDSYTVHAVPNGTALIEGVVNGDIVSSARVPLDELRPEQGAVTGYEFTIPAGVPHYALTVKALSNSVYQQGADDGSESQLPLFTIFFTPPTP